MLSIICRWSLFHFHLRFKFKKQPFPVYSRPWHDARAITRANQEKGGLGKRWKTHPKVKLHGLISPRKISNSSSRTHLNWFNRIYFKLIILTLFFKPLYLKTNLNFSYLLLLDIFSTIMQWGFCKYVLLKHVKIFMLYLVSLSW